MRSLKGLLQWFFWRYLKGIARLKPINTLPLLTGPAFFFSRMLSGMRSVLLAEELRASGLAGGGGDKKLLERELKTKLNSQLKLSCLARLGPGSIEEDIPIDGREHLDRALAPGKGAILLNPHFGPFMLIMPALGHRGYKVNQVALQGEPITGKRTGLARLAYEAKFDAIEGNMPVKFINASDNRMSIRSVLKALKSGEIVLFASTGRGGTNWGSVDFLGRRANFNLLPFKLALSSGAALVPVFLTDETHYARAVVESQIETGEHDTEESLLKKYVVLLEQYVKKYPEHFGNYLFEMRRNCGWDDHPLFDDYPKDKKRGR